MKKKGLRTMAVWGLLLIGVLIGVGFLGIAATGPDGASGAIAFTWLPVAGLVYGVKMFEWKNIEKYKTTEEKKEKIFDAYNHFLAKVQKAVPGQAVTGQKMTGADANLINTIPIVLVQSDTIKTPDRGYEMIFDEVDMRQSQSDAFDVLNVSGGVTFYQTAPGEEVKLTKIPTSSLTKVNYLKFTGGLTILDEWLRFNKFYLIDRLFGDTTKRYYNKRATLFYGLITALSGTQAFDTDDAKTINNACANILVDLEATGYDVDENTSFVIVCNPLLKFRIAKALAATFGSPNTNTNQIVYNVNTLVVTTKVASTNYWVGVPGIQNQRGEWEDLIAKVPQEDLIHGGNTHVWEGMYNGIAGESKQWKKCNLS